MIFYKEININSNGGNAMAARMTEEKALENAILAEKQEWVLIQNHGSPKKAREHIDAIDAFIPRANAFAHKYKTANNDSYDFLFHKEMNRLTREAGIRNL